MTPLEFVLFYGLDNFKRDWPALRAALLQETLKFASVFDVAWSHAVGGGWNLVPGRRLLRHGGQAQGLPD